jgi:hypothetical protein
MSGWLPDVVLTILRYLLTIVPVAIASGTALWIAYKVYPKQKKIDRDNDIRKERRAIYGRVIDRLYELDDELLALKSSAADPNELLRQVLGIHLKAGAVIRSCAFYATKEVTNALRECLDAFWGTFEAVLEDERLKALRERPFDLAEFVDIIDASLQDTRKTRLSAIASLNKVCRDKELGEPSEFILVPASKYLSTVEELTR